MKTYLPLILGALVTALLAGCAEKEGADTAPAPSPSPFPPEVTAMIDQYEATAVELTALLGSAPTGQDHEVLVESLFDLSEGITPAFVARNPECRAYLEAALQVRTLWPTLDAETLERDYHDDGALPSEGTKPACYHMKDLIVHPASAAALMRQDPPDAASAKREIDEVLSHVGVVRRG